MGWSAPTVKAVGDVVYAADINGISADLTFLAAPPLSSAYSSSASLTTTSGTTLIVKFNVPIIDQDPTGNQIYVPSTGTWTVQTDGIYEGDGQVTFLASSSASGVRQGAWYVNGVQECQSIRPGSTTAKVSVPAVLPKMRLSAGDYLYIGAYQTSGSNLNLDNQTQGTFGELRYVSA